MRHLTMCVLFCVIFVSVLCINVKFVQASNGLEISEIMYDPSGTDTNREWIEVHNTGSDSIDLANHFLLTDGLSSSRHTLTPVGSSIIVSGHYAVIVQDVNAFKTDYPSYTGLLFDSSWSGLTASVGKTIAIIDNDGAVLDQVTYDPSIGGANDGNSLQKSAQGTWVSSLPNPNGAVQNGDAVSTETDTGTSNGGTNSSGISSAVPTAVLKIVQPKVIPPRIDFTIPKIATTGIPISVEYTVYGANDDIRFYGSTHIAFGDGTEYGGSAKDETTHTYEFPGTYIVKLDYRSNPYMPKPDLTTRVTVIVSHPTVVISSITSTGSIQLQNTSTDESDISGWILTSVVDDKKTQFSIPEGTILAPEARMQLPASIVGFLGDAPIVTLSLPRHIEVSSFQLAQEDPPLEPVVQTSVRELEPTIGTERIQKTITQNTDTKNSAMVVPVGSRKNVSLIWYTLFLLGVIICFGYALIRFVGIKKHTETISSVVLAGDDEKQIDPVRIVEE